MAERDMEGYVLLNRNILDWRWARTPNTAYLFILMILKANFKDKQFENRVIKRGQFITSVQNLAKLSGMSTQEVRTALQHLKATNEITYESTNRYRIITIINYNDYQTPTNILTNRQQADSVKKVLKSQNLTGKSTSKLTSKDNGHDADNSMFAENDDNDVQQASQQASQQSSNKQITNRQQQVNKYNTVNTRKKRIPPKSPKGDLTPSGGEKQYDNLHAATMMPRDVGTYDDIPLVYRDGTYQSFKTWEEYWDWSNQ